MPKNHPTKKCKDCGRFHPLGEYLPMATNKDGLGSKCPACRSKKYRAYALKNAIAFDRTKAPHEKRCFRCEQTKPQTEFTINRSVPDGLDRLCRTCKSELARTYHRNHREHNLWTKWRMTLAQYETLKAAQHGCCALCQIDLNEVRQPAVDHDHGTGATRGILCPICNTMLGRIERPGFIGRLLIYLKHSSMMRPIITYPPSGSS